MSAERRRARGAAGVFIAHVILAVAAFLTMDLDLAWKPLRDTLNALIDMYELVGFGVFPVGIGAVTLVLAGVWIALARGSARAELQTS